MKKLDELFEDTLRDMYFAEKLITKELPRMAKKASNAELKAGFLNHTEETLVHIDRLEQVFEILGLNPRAKRCLAIQGIFEEAHEVLDEVETPELRDAAMIIGARKVEHYEMCNYMTLISYADLLGHKNIIKILNQTLTEEKATDEMLGELSPTINKAAM